MPFLLEHLKQEYTKKNERMGLNASQDTYLTYTHNKKKTIIMITGCNACVTRMCVCALDVFFCC